MERFVSGDIVVTPFPLKDLSSNIKRPALVLATLRGEDIILCQITSKNHELDPYQKEIGIGDLDQGSLKAKSFIKPSIIFTTRKSILLYRLGKIKKKKVN